MKNSEKLLYIETWVLGLPQVSSSCDFPVGWIEVRGSSSWFHCDHLCTWTPCPYILAGQQVHVQTRSLHRWVPYPEGPEAPHVLLFSKATTPRRARDCSSAPPWPLRRHTGRWVRPPHSCPVIPNRDTAGPFRGRGDGPFMDYIFTTQKNIIFTTSMGLFHTSILADVRKFRNSKCALTSPPKTAKPGFPRGAHITWCTRNWVGPTLQIFHWYGLPTRALYLFFMTL